LNFKSRIFIDFWNFQLNWNSRASNAPCDWKALPRVLLAESRKLLEAASTTNALELHETLVYASVKASGDENLKNWLNTFLDRQPGFRVESKTRRVRSGAIWCNSCQTTIGSCPHCNVPLQRSPEKGIDAAIATDLLSLSWQGVLDIAILVSGDADFIPAVERIQQQGLKVVNATWQHHGHELAHTCWGSFHLDSLIEQLIRE